MLQNLIAQGAALIVEKGKLAANGEYNLSGERYQTTETRSSCYAMVPFKSICTLEYGSSLPRKKRVDGPYPVMGSNGISGYHNKYLIEGPAIIIGRKGSAGEVVYVESNCFPIDTTYFVKLSNPKHTDILYLYHLLKTLDLPSLRGGAGIPGLNRNDVYEKYKLPLPPLEVQREIVAEIEGYQRVIDGARAVVDNYRPQIAVDPEWPTTELKKVCKRLQYGLSVRLNTERRGYKTFRMNELVEGKCVDRGDMKCADIPAEEFEKYRLIRGDILFNRTNSLEHVGRAGIFDLEGIYCFASYLIRLSISADCVNPFYINAFMNTEQFQTGIKQYATRAIGQSNINAKSLAAYLIPLPPITTQNQIAAEIEAEQSLVAANRELVDRMEGKIRATIGRVWREGETKHG